MEIIIMVMDVIHHAKLKVDGYAMVEMPIKEIYARIIIQSHTQLVVNKLIKNIII